jgi:serine/threonine protein kinase
METILLLETISSHAEMMREHLEKRNFKVLVSPSTLQAREILEKQTTDVLVIDLNIADQDFFKFYRWLMDQPETALIPRLFIAGKLQQEIAEQLESTNKETVLNKPLDLNRFMSTIERLKAGKSTILRKNRRQDYFETLIGKKIRNINIIKEIGRGGMGAVFLGHQENLDRKVAVKLLLPEMVGDATAIERFQREALAIARLKSPHIVQVYDFGELENHAFYISMEYIPGQTLDYILRHKGRFPIAKAISVITQVATGLNAAHDAGLIHRDIKPSNLILDNKGHVTITDFGLVRPQKKSKQTQAGMIVGTPHYLPPEQASEAPLDARSDIYSLGIVFFHLVVGHPPYLSNNPMEILMKHMSEPLPDPRQFVPAIPQEIVDIIERMTAKDPASRYINSRELLWDLKSSDIDDSNDISHIKEVKKSTSAKTPDRIVVDTSLFQGHSELKKQFPALFTHDNILGAMTLTESGTMLTSQGNFPDEWKNALYVLQESTIELNAAAKLGQWHFKIVETPEEVLAIFPEGINLGTLLVTQKDTQSFSGSSLKASTGTFISVKHSTDPIQQIASIAGVTDVLLFDPAGHLVDHALSDTETFESFKLRFAPVAQIIQSITFHITGLDLWYEKGRIMIWTLEHGILFVIGNLGVSRSFLSIYITAHLEQLNTNTQTAIGPPLEKTGVISKTGTKSIKKEVKNPVEIALMEKIQLELAQHIGPIAKVVLSKDCKRMGYTRGKFPQDRLLELIKHLSQHVDESKQQLFSDNVQDIIYDFRSKEQA